MAAVVGALLARERTGHGAQVARVAHLRGPREVQRSYLGQPHCAGDVWGKAGRRVSGAGRSGLHSSDDTADEEPAGAQRVLRGVVH